MVRKLVNLLRGERMEHDLDRELRYHVERRVTDFIASGLSEPEARRQAALEFGSVAEVREEVQDTWIWRWLRDLLHDLRYATRVLRGSPGFTAAAALSLALGIGASTAIFSFMDALLLRSLPVSDPQSLVRLAWRTRQDEVHGMNRHDDSYLDGKTGFVGGFFSYPAFELFRRNAGVFSSVMGYQGAGDLNLSVAGQAEIAKTEYVAGDYFRGLGVAPASGRLIAPNDDIAGAPHVAVISFALSEKRFGGASNAAGQQILLNNLPFTVIGVAPPEFFGVDPAIAPNAYVPIHTQGLWEPNDRTWATGRRFIDPDFDWVDIMARLRPGITSAQAQAVLAPQFAEFERNATMERSRDDLASLVLFGGARGLDSLRRTYSKPLYVLLALVGLILAIASANIANLLLARVSARRREIAVRLSMGAGRMRLVRQLLTESVLLAAMGGALGVGVAVWGIHALALLLGFHADLNWRVLAGTAALSIATGILFGLAPALQATRIDLAPALKQSRTGGRRTRSGLGRMLVVAQIAFTLLILVAAGLFAQTLSNLRSIELGFNRDNVLTFAINASQAGYRAPAIAAFYENLRTQFAAIPGVRSASLSQLALLGQGRTMTMIGLPDVEPKGSLILNVGARFFSTMQIPILLGREIDGRDRANTAMTAVVNRTFAKEWFGEQNPVGRHITVSDCPKCDVKIVGVSADVRYGRLKQKFQPAVFFPFAQWPVEDMTFEVRSAGNPLSYVQAVRDIVHNADARIPVADIATQGALIDGIFNREIAFARLCTAFALLALAIASVGLYGTMSFNVARRTGEIGIRMALGAERLDIARMVLRETILLVAAGLALGIAVSSGGARLAGALISDLLYGLKPDDVTSVILAVATLSVVAAFAGLLPARRASRIDPMIAIRYE
jgi:macrolide transport system ATP-binding/permease protein